MGCLGQAGSWKKDMGWKYNMKKGNALFFIGLVMFMLGIYLSIYWVVIGTLLGVAGGMIIGISSYFLAKKKQ